MKYSSNPPLAALTWAPTNMRSPCVLALSGMASSSFSSFVFLFFEAFAVMVVLASGSSCLAAPFLEGLTLIEASDSSSISVLTVDVWFLVHGISCVIWKVAFGRLLLGIGSGSVSIDLP